MKNILFLVFFCFCLNGFACFNEYETDESGHSHEVNVSQPYPYRNYLKRYNRWNHRELNHLLRKIKHFSTEKSYVKLYQLQSDYAVKLAKLGRPEPALTIFKKLANEYPNEYQIIANLATTYELNGQLDSAYKYMQQSLVLNPKSHHGSEWIHLRILEAAIEHRDKGIAFKDMNILKLDTIRHNTTSRFADAIADQLRERMPLSSSPNELLAKVLEESGDYLKKNTSAIWGFAMHIMAAGYTRDEEIEQNLRTKMTQSREILITGGHINKNPKGFYVGKYLLEENWQLELNKRIAYWKKYTLKKPKHIKVAKW